MITAPFECTGRLEDPGTRKSPERLPPQGPPPPPPPRSLERVPPNPATLGETVELSASDDPCPGSFGTEQPEPAVHMAIYHYASRVGHFQTRKPTGPAGTHRLVGSNPYPRDQPSRKTSELKIQDTSVLNRNGLRNLSRWALSLIRPGCPFARP